MWWLIIIGIIGFVSLVLMFIANHKEGTGTFFFCVSLSVIITMTVASSLLIYHRGKAVVLSNMPKSLSQGTVYTVVGLANGFATVTDECKERWNNYAQEDLRTMWLVNLAQTNVVVGKKYMIADNPKHVAKYGKDELIFIEVNP